MLIGESGGTASEPCPDIEISPTSSDPHCVAPDYAKVSGLVGGSAIGFVEFEIYGTDCDPPFEGVDVWNTTAGATPLLNSQFSHWVNSPPDPETTPKSATMRFYGDVGSIGTGTSAHPAVSVWIWLYNSFWRDITDLVVVSVSGREFKVHGNGSLLPPGYYAVLAKVEGPDRLYSANTLAAPAHPEVLPNSENADGEPVVQYNFYLFRDCNPNNEIDSPLAECWGSFCPADCDDGSGTGTPDGGVTIDDLLYYLNHFENGC